MARTLSTFHTGHSGALHDAQFDYYGKRLATASSDHTIRIWDLSTQPVTSVAELRGHEGPVWQVCWAHPKFGSLLASCSYDKKIFVWKQTAYDKWIIAFKGEEHTASVNCLSWAPWEFGLHLASGSADGTVCVWSYRPNSLWSKRSFQGHSNGVNGISWSPASVGLVFGVGDGPFGMLGDSRLPAPSGIPEETGGQPLQQNQNENMQSQYQNSTKMVDSHPQTYPGNDPGRNVYASGYQSGSGGYFPSLGNSADDGNMKYDRRAAYVEGDGSKPYYSSFQGNEDNSQRQGAHTGIPPQDFGGNRNEGFGAMNYSSYGQAPPNYIAGAASQQQGSFQIGNQLSQTTGGDNDFYNPNNTTYNPGATSFIGTGQGASPNAGSGIQQPGVPPSGHQVGGEVGAPNSMSNYVVPPLGSAVYSDIPRINSIGNFPMPSDDYSGRRLYQLRLSNNNVGSTGSGAMRIVTGGCDNQVRVWRFDEVNEKWVELNQMLDNPHSDWVRDVAWRPKIGLPSSMIASCSEDYTVILWIQKSESEAWKNQQVLNIGAPVWKVSWSITGAVLAVASGDNKVSLFKENIDGYWENVSHVLNETKPEEQATEEMVPGDKSDSYLVADAENKAVKARVPGYSQEVVSEVRERSDGNETYIRQDGGGHGALSKEYSGGFVAGSRGENIGRAPDSRNVGIPGHSGASYLGQGALIPGTRNAPGGAQASLNDPRVANNPVGSMSGYKAPGSTPPMGNPPISGAYGGQPMDAYQGGSLPVGIDPINNYNNPNPGAQVTRNNNNVGPPGMPWNNDKGSSVGRGAPPSAGIDYGGNRYSKYIPPGKNYS